MLSSKCLDQSTTLPTIDGSIAYCRCGESSAASAQSKCGSSVLPGQLQLAAGAVNGGEAAGYNTGLGCSLAGGGGRQNDYDAVGAPRADY